MAPKIVQKRYLKLFENAPKSKPGHESTLYLTDFADFSVVEELRLSAFKRRQARQISFGIGSIRGHVLI